MTGKLVAGRRQRGERRGWTQSNGELNATSNRQSAGTVVGDVEGGRRAEEARRKERGGAQQEHVEWNKTMLESGDWAHDHWGGGGSNRQGATRYWGHFPFLPCRMELLCAGLLRCFTNRGPATQHCGETDLALNRRPTPLHHAHVTPPLVLTSTQSKWDSRGRAPFNHSRPSHDSQLSLRNMLRGLFLFLIHLHLLAPFPFNSTLPTVVSFAFAVWEL